MCILALSLSFLGSFCVCGVFSSFAALVIVEDPFPLVITKGKQLDDDPVVVQLLSGSNVEFQSFSKVKVALVCENQQGKANNQKAIENDTQTMDVFRRIVKWHLKFLNGTRKNPVNLRFGMQIQLSQGPTVTIESGNSQPLIVITNECQWEESEGALIKRDAFGDQVSSRSSCYFTIILDSLLPLIFSTFSAYLSSNSL
jgi:hypothetical protein